MPVLATAALQLLGQSCWPHRLAESFPPQSTQKSQAGQALRDSSSQLQAGASLSEPAQTSACLTCS